MEPTSKEIAKQLVSQADLAQPLSNKSARALHKKVRRVLSALNGGGILELKKRTEELEKFLAPIPMRQL